MSVESSISEGLTDEDWEKVRSRFAAYNAEESGGLSGNPGVVVQLALKNGDGQIRGALTGRTIYKSLLIDIVWIEEAHHGRGYGRALVSETERIAQSNGCISAQTSSYSFQAPEFYQALGYEVFGEFDGYPDGIRKYYLGKTL
jgi:GNAT superfamily N-acetyltransferase